MLLASYPLSATTSGTNCQEDPGHAGGTSWPRVPRPLTCVLSCPAEAPLTPFLRQGVQESCGMSLDLSSGSRGILQGKEAKGQERQERGAGHLNY